ALRARWFALRAAFVEAAAPVIEALDRADRLRGARTARPSRALEAEAAYAAAKQNRERAEAALAAAVGDNGRDGGEANRGLLDGARLPVSQIQSRLSALRNDKQRLLDSLVTRGNPRAAAESTAGAFFNNRITAEETRLQKAQAALDRAKAVQDQ